MPGAQWLALRCKHIPDRDDEHLVRSVGWYSNRARGERAKEASPHAAAALPAIVNLLHGEIVKMRKQPDFVERFESNGMEPAMRSIRWNAPSARGRCG